MRLAIVRSFLSTSRTIYWQCLLPASTFSAGGSPWASLVWEVEWTSSSFHQLPQGLLNQVWMTGTARPPFLSLTWTLVIVRAHPKLICSHLDPQLNYMCKDPTSKYSHILRLQVNMSLGGHYLFPCAASYSYKVTPVEHPAGFRKF